MPGVKHIFGIWALFFWGSFTSPNQLFHPLTPDSAFKSKQKAACLLLNEKHPAPQIPT